MAKTEGGVKRDITEVGRAAGDAKSGFDSGKKPDTDLVNALIRTASGGYPGMMGEAFGHWYNQLTKPAPTPIDKNAWDHRFDKTRFKRAQDSKKRVADEVIREYAERTINGRVLRSTREAEAIREYLERSGKSYTRAVGANSKYKRGSNGFKGGRKQYASRYRTGGGRSSAKYGKYQRRGGQRRRY